MHGALRLDWQRNNTTASRLDASPKRSGLTVTSLAADVGGLILRVGDRDRAIKDCPLPLLDTWTEPPI